MAPTIPTIKLNTGAEMPLVGFGLWKVDKDRCAQVVYDAIKEGYRLFDGACDYGNEVEAGQGVKRAIDEGIVKREDLFIVSKLWNSFHDPERVGPICKKQLADWGVDYFDLYLIHFPVAIKYVDPSVRYPPGWFYEGESVEYAKCSLQETYQAMEKLVGAGLTKAIGVSNYSGALMLDLFAYSKIRPATLQIEHHPYLVQPDLLKLCKESGVTVTAYSSFGPQSFLDLGMERAAAADVQILWDHPAITKIAKAHGKTAAQVLLRWATQRGLAVIPKTTRLQVMRENLDIVSWDLTDEEIREISSLDRKLKFNDPLNYGINVPCFA